jgi:NADPH:quinone reductase-like Zn-dependent oxidoreductase
MGARRDPTRPEPEPERHEIRVQGHLDDRWGDGVEGLTFTHEPDGTTTLTGPLADQAALHGLLNRFRDLNVPIVSVRRLSDDAEPRTTMRAVVQDEYGSTDVLRLSEIGRPEIGDDDVLVRVHAAGLHIGDWHLMTGRPYLMRVMGFGFRAPKARVRGMDVAGTVAAVGRNVTRLRAGDAVFGICDGAFAEYARAGAATLAPTPASLTFEQAAAVPTSACVALQALRDKGAIQPGQQLLIVGASGGVGLFAVQIAKALGAEVTGVCSTSKLELVRAVGADRVVDYTREDVTRSGRRYDLVLDMGGNRPVSALRRVLTPRGTLVLVGGEGGDRWTGGMGRSLGALVASSFASQRVRMLNAWANAEDLRFLTELIEAGRVRPVIDRTYPLSGVQDAIGHLSRGGARGKLVITVRGEDGRPSRASSVRTAVVTTA